MFFDNFIILAVYRYELFLEWKQSNDVITDVISDDVYSITDAGSSMTFATAAKRTGTI